MSVEALRIEQVRMEPARVVALALPVAVPVATIATFAATQAVLGDHLGYVAGFGIYWAACAALSGTILGRRGVACLTFGGSST